MLLLPPPLVRYVACFFEAFRRKVLYGTRFDACYILGIDHVNTEILGSDPTVNIEACVDIYLSSISVKVVALRRTNSLSE
jgi:hypothetical protein